VQRVSGLLLVAREPQQPPVPLLEEVLEPALLLSTPLLSLAYYELTKRKAGSVTFRPDRREEESEQISGKARMLM
jgi:hypothetical protein